MAFAKHPGQRIDLSHWPAWWRQSQKDLCSSNFFATWKPMNKYSVRQSFAGELRSCSAIKVVHKKFYRDFRLHLRYILLYWIVGCYVTYWKVDTFDFPMRFFPVKKKGASRADKPQVAGHRAWSSCSRCASVRCHRSPFGSYMDKGKACKWMIKLLFFPWSITYTWGLWLPPCAKHVWENWNQVTK